MIFVGYRKDALRTLEVARLEAEALNHNYVGTEHLLLALTVEDFGIATNALHERGITEVALKKQVARENSGAPEGFSARDAGALATFGIDLDEVRRRVEQTFGPFALDSPPPCPTGTPISEKAMQALRATPQLARRLGHRKVAPEHLLLALMDDEGTLATRLVRRLGTTPNDLRDRTLTAITST